MPVFSVKSGSKWSNKPESFAEVVEATTIDLPCASTGPAKKTALQKTAMNTNIGLRCESISAPNPIKIVLLQNGTFDFSQNSIEANVRYWPQSGHALVHCTCPLSGVKRTFLPEITKFFARARALRAGSPGILRRASTGCWKARM